MIDAAKLAAEIERAKDRQVACEEQGDRAGVEAWHGYTRALRWVEAQGVPDGPVPEDAQACSWCDGRGWVKAVARS